MSRTKEKESLPVNDQLEQKRKEFQERVAGKKKLKNQKKQIATHAKKKWLIGGAIAAVVVLVGGGLAYALWYQNPERVVGEAILNALQAESVAYTGSLNVAGTPSISATVNGASEGAKGSKFGIKLTTQSDKQSQTLTIDSVTDDKGTVYVNAGGIKTLLGRDILGGASTPGSYASELLQKVDGKWLRVTSAELQPYSHKVASAQSCIEDVVKKIQNDQPLFHEAVSIYKDHAFLTVARQLGSRDGSNGYSVRVDDDKLRAFLEGLKTTSLYQELHNCDSSTFDIAPESILKKLDSSSIHVTALDVWISPQKHEITEVNLESMTGDTKATASLRPEFNQKVKLVIPDNAQVLTLEQVHSYMEAGFDASVIEKTTDNPKAQQQYKTLLEKLKTS